MIYKDFKELKLSMLGLGAMRFPLLQNGEIDKEQTAEMIDYALKNGINYFDTAWFYHDGKSETVLGELLSKYPRESYFLASKFPGCDTSTFVKKEEIFEKQLEKCKVDYFDFYLFHSVNDSNIDFYLDESLGLTKYLLKQKKAGKIRHLGFSAHASFPVFKRFLEAYSEHLEFCQLQINYLDWNLQNVKEYLDCLKSYNIPVWIMEPVRGGGLANPPQAIKKQLEALFPNKPIPSIAFRFLQAIDEATVILSGMSNMQQLKDNIETFKTNEPVAPELFKKLTEIGDLLAKGVPCTSCRYCVKYCPNEIEIPNIINLYNANTYEGKEKISSEILANIEESKRPTACIECKACEGICPQQIKISQVMKSFCEKLI
ncbi:MAG: 4Fe-4S dicluster domain-containing protein [Ruminococcaceae bacterium]|nr:4Fe-4S dicluster domain-containing protein [Oscillospiraceae bacterium]